jgi:hypothetical protein
MQICFSLVQKKNKTEKTTLYGRCGGIYFLLKNKNDFGELPPGPEGPPAGLDGLLQLHTLSPG